MPRVMIVDDYELVQLGLKGLLANHDNLTFVAEAGTLKDAAAKAVQVRARCDFHGCKAAQNIFLRLDVIK